MKSKSLKRRFFALALLAAFAATMFAPVRQAHAGGWPSYPTTSGGSGTTTNVNWNTGTSNVNWNGGTTNNVNWNGGPQ